MHIIGLVVCNRGHPSGDGRSRDLARHAGEETAGARCTQKLEPESPAIYTTPLQAR